MMITCAAREMNSDVVFQVEATFSRYCLKLALTHDQSRTLDHLSLFTARVTQKKTPFPLYCTPLIAYWTGPFNFEHKSIFKLHPL